MDYTQEVQTKLARAREVMAANNVDTLWLRTVNNVAWITGGVDTAVNTADTVGVGSAVITPDKAQIWTTTIEGPRFKGQDDVEARGFEVVATPWDQAAPAPTGAALGVDGAMPGATDLSGAIVGVRQRLLPVEQDRFRALGAACASAMQESIRRVQPGQTEHEIAAILSEETRKRGANPIVCLIATDERIHQFRHPLPTGKVLDKYAMLVLCGRTDGLVCSVTRLVHFGAFPDDLRRKMDACAEIDAAITAASVPGATIGDLFTVLTDAYARVGFADEWKLHHQGGTAGYGAREIIATPGDPTPLEAGMACAWNPSITGTKCEDTIMVSGEGQPPAILTAMADWPVRTVEVDGMTLARPVVLEV